MSVKVPKFEEDPMAKANKGKADSHKKKSKKSGKFPQTLLNKTTADKQTGGFQKSKKLSMC